MTRPWPENQGEVAPKRRRLSLFYAKMTRRTPQPHLLGPFSARRRSQRHLRSPFSTRRSPQRHPRYPFSTHQTPQPQLRSPFSTHRSPHRHPRSPRSVRESLKHLSDTPSLSLSGLNALIFIRSGSSESLSYIFLIDRNFPMRIKYVSHRFGDFRTDYSFHYKSPEVSDQLKPSIYRIRNLPKGYNI